MTAGLSRSDAAREIARLSHALADALEGGDLDAAERVVAERGRLLDAVTHHRLPADAPDGAAVAEAHAAVLAADRRSARALARAVDGARGSLGTLAAGARAMRAYLPVEPLAPGYVDRHD
jgi:hypothetical protein